MLPRPHHDLQVKKQSGTDTKQHYHNQQHHHRPGGGGYHSDLPGGEDKRAYQPVPDSRFYTKANFFSLADQKQALMSGTGTGSGIYSTYDS